MNIVHSCAITLLLLTTVLSAQSGLDWRGHDVFPRYNYSGFAQDTHRNKVVRYGGWRRGILSNETWEWDGRHWRQMHPKQSPPPLSSPILGYDAVTQRVILFGGISAFVSPQGVVVKSMSRQTWAWDGKNWVQLKPKNQPGPRFSNGAGMVTDLKHKQLLLYGGSVPGGLFSLPLEDFWAWNGKDWKLIMIQAPPGRMRAYSSGFHAKSGQVVFFGGQPLGTSNIFVYSDATWAWDGKVWKRLGNSSSSWARPSPRICGRLCESPADGSLLLHGGQFWDSFNFKEIHYDDLWSFDGKQWKLLSGSTGLPKNPELRTKDLYRFGKEIQQIFKDRVGYGISDVRRWTGKKWELLERLPESRAGILVHDARNQEVLAFGGAPVSSVWTPTKLLVYRLRNGRFEEIPTKFQPPQFLGIDVFYDPILNKVVYFEMLSTKNRSLTIWLWDGHSWTKNGETPKVPIGTNGCYVPTWKKTVLPGWKSTWTWDGKKFQKLADHKDPVFLEIAYDLRRKVLVGYGPDSRSRDIYYTWEWTGKAWKKLTTPTKPPQMNFAKLLFYPELGKVVLAGGYRLGLTQRTHQETWAYDGKDWQQLKVSLLPLQERSGAGMTSMIYDPGQSRLLGLYSNAHVALRELSFRSLSLSAPLIRTGERTSFDIDLPKAAGQFFLLGLSLGRDPGIPLYHEKDIGTRLLPLALDTMLLWSFSGPILTQLDAKGRGSIPFAIPKIPNLPELDIWAAGFTLDPKQSFRIGATSNRAILQIVR